MEREVTVLSMLFDKDVPAMTGPKTLGIQIAKENHQRILPSCSSDQKCEAKAGAKLSQKHGFKDLSALSAVASSDVWCGLWPKRGLNIARPLVGDTRFGGIVRSVGDKIVPVACNFGFLAREEGQRSKVKMEVGKSHMIKRYKKQLQK